MATPASNLVVYSVIAVQINNQPLYEEARVRIDRSTASIAVKSTARGYGGESPSAAMTEVEIESNVPSTGFDGPVSLDAIALSLTPVNFIMSAAGQNMNFNGFITNINMEHGVDSSSKVIYRARGSFSTFS